MGIKISDLTIVDNLANSDSLPIVNGDETKKVTIEQIKDYISSGSNSSQTIYNMNISWYFDTEIYFFDDSEKTKINDILNMVYSSGSSTLILNLIPPLNSYIIGAEHQVTLPFLIINDIQKQPFYLTGYVIIPNKKYFRVDININSWEDNKAILNGAGIYQFDYTMASTQYVDDSIKTAIGDVLGGNY